MYRDIRIYGEEDCILDLNPNGTITQQGLQTAKQELLSKLLEGHVEELVNYTQHYPENKTSRVNLKTNFVIMDSHSYNKMLKIIGGLPEERQNLIEKYINLPKLKV